MAATLTPNYGWTQPEIGGDATTWGNELNNDLALIDAQVYANEQATVLIGAMMLWPTPTPPTNWLICNGASLATVGTYAALFGVIGYTFGGSGVNFNLPNLTGVFPFGAGGTGGVALGATGGASTATLSIAQLPAHAHPITDLLHNHGINQTPHQHPDGTHAHGASQGPHDHGGNIVGGQTPGGNLAGQIGGAQYPPSRTDSQQPPVTVNPSGANIGPTNANLSLNPSGTGLSTTNPVGSGSPVPTMPPFLGINFIIRFQ